MLAKFVFLDFLRNLGHWMVNGSEKKSMLKKVPILRSTSMSIALGGGQTEFLLLWTFVCWPSLIDFLRNLGHWMVNGSEKKSMLKKVLIPRFISMSIALGGSD